MTIVPSTPSQAELELQAQAKTAAESKSTNPWGPLGKLLAKHAGGTGRAIGIQDSTVIDRAIGSPGMLKELDVHGFEVLRHASRKSADLEDVVDKVVGAIEAAPYISTAVVIPYTTDFLPSHVLSCDPETGGRLAELYPSATPVLGLTKRGGDTDLTHPAGPWIVTPVEHLVHPDGSRAFVMDDPDDETRFLTIGDAVIVREEQAGGVSRYIGVGRVHHVAPIGDMADRRLALIVDRYAPLPPTGEEPNESGSAQPTGELGGGATDGGA